MGPGQQGPHVRPTWQSQLLVHVRSTFLCFSRKHALADDKADLREFKERFLKGNYCQEKISYSIEITRDICLCKVHT